MNAQTLLWAWLAASIIPCLRIVTEAVTLPACQVIAPQQNVLGQVRTAELSVPLPPFGLQYAAQKDIAFVALDMEVFAGNSSLGVLNTSTFPPTLIEQVTLPAAQVRSGEALGLTLTKDSRYVLVAGGEGAFIVDSKKAIKGDNSSIVGILSGTSGNQSTGNGSIEVILSHDQKYAFVSQEYGANPGKTTGNIDVFELHKPAANGTVASTHVGHLDLGYAVVGTALSPDGHLLYAASETTTANDTTPGVLSVIDVKTLKTNPSEAQRFNVTAGCGPVRIIVSKNGKTVWVTARESNHLLAFNATKLAANMSDALIASVQVGTSPIGLTFVQNERLILTADSNRFNYTNATTGISVVDVQAVLNGSSQSALGRVSTGFFSREFAVSRDGQTVLVSEYGSNRIQAIDVSTLP